MSLKKQNKKKFVKSSLARKSHSLTFRSTAISAGIKNGFLEMLGSDIVTKAHTDINTGI